MVPPARVSRRVLLPVEVLFDESVQVPVPAAPPVITVVTPPETLNLAISPFTGALPVMIATLPVALGNENVLSVLATAVISKVPYGPVPPTTRLALIVSVGGLVVSTINELPIDDGLSALGIVPVVRPVKPPVDDVPQVKVWFVPS